MVNKKFWLGILAIVLVFGMTVVGCDGNNPTNDPQTVDYEGKDVSGNTYVLTVTKKADRAAYTPVEGDSYVLIIKITGQSEKKSNGIVKIVSTDGTFTLQPSVKDSATFSIVISNGKISSIVGAIAVDGGETITPRSFSTIYLRARRHSNDGGEGEDWTSGRDIILSDFFTSTLKANTKYKVKISGTVDKEIEHFQIQFMRVWNNGDWKWIGGTNQISVSGAINDSYDVRIDDQTVWLQNDGEISVSLSNMIRWTPVNGQEQNYGSIPENIPDGTIMATVSNLSISLIEVQQ